MEALKTVNATTNGGQKVGTAKINLHRDSQRVSVKHILTDHFRKTK